MPRTRRNRRSADYDSVINVLERHGWSFASKDGHRTFMDHPDFLDIIWVPRLSGRVLLDQLKAISKQTGITVEALKRG